MAKTGWETLTLFTNEGAVVLLSDSGFDEDGDPPNVAAIAVTPDEGDEVMAFLLKSSAGAASALHEDLRGLGLNVDGLVGDAERG